MDADLLHLDKLALRIVRRKGYGVVVNGVMGSSTTWYLDGVMGDPLEREAFFSAVDTHGVVVCRNLDIDPTPYRGVRGKRSRGRLSQGEFFHHDGCSTPVKPRVVEIRCPEQACVRTMGTSVAPFPDVVRALLAVIPPAVKRTEALAAFDEAVAAGLHTTWDHESWEAVQGAVNRALRGMAPEAARELLAHADTTLPCFREPWTLRESRFIANNNRHQTAQHRRVCTSWSSGEPNGHLHKRWPAEELV